MAPSNRPEPPSQESFASEVPATPAVPAPVASETEAKAEARAKQAQGQPRKVERAAPPEPELPPLPRNTEVPVMRIWKSDHSRVVLINCTDYDELVHEPASEEDRKRGEKALDLKRVADDKTEQQNMFKRLVRGQ
jgi:hypothetical protein